MAITESLPVGNEVAAVAAGKTAAVDATAFAATFAAAGKAAGGAVAGKNAVVAPAVPVKGQQDLVGWDAGHGLDGSGEQTLHDAGQVGAGPDAGDGASAVSSLIGKQEIVEIADGPSGGAGNEDLQNATVGAGMQQAVWTAGENAGKVDGVAGTPANNSAGGALPGAAKLDLVSHSILKSVSEQGNEVPATSKVAISTTPAVIPAPAESDAGVWGKAEIIASGKAQAPSVAATGQPVADSVADELAGTARMVAAKTETSRTATAEPHKSANAGALRVGDKGSSVSGSSRKAEVTAEATLSSKDSSPVPSVGVEPGAALVAQVPAPVAPVVMTSPVASEGKTTDGSGVKSGPVSGSEILPAPSGVTETPSRAVARPRASSLAEVGARTADGATATRSPATVAKRVNEPGGKIGTLGENVVGAPTVSASMGDGSSALPVVVGVAAAPPQVIAASEGSQTGVAGVQGVEAQVATVAKGQSPATVVKDKDGKNATSNVQRGATDTRGAHPAAADSGTTVTTSAAPENLAAGKSSSAHEGGVTAGIAGAPVAVSNAHGTTASGWSGGLVAPAAPARSEVSGVTTAASTGSAAKAQDGGLASGLGSGLSSGLVESGQGHTTLQATPTVLEVGVPGGTHGWLKIRAELSEGGTVQASVSSATEAGQETLRKELPAMSAYLQSEHVPVSLQMAHGVATVAGGPVAAGLMAGDGLGSGSGSHAGAHPDQSPQSRNDAAAFAGTSAGTADAGDSGSGRQQGPDGGQVSGASATGASDGVSAAVVNADADWTSSPGYGGVSLTTGGVG